MDTTTAFPNTAEDLTQQIINAPRASLDLAVISTESLKHFTPQAQAEIMKIANQIDPLQIDKILAYGSIPLLRTYESAGQILKAAEGTSVDQDVVKQVVELSKLVNKGQEDLNVALQEPNIFERLIMNIFSSVKEKHDTETKIKAISCYKLLTQLRDSCEAWHAMLQENYILISQSIQDDMQNGIELEKYLVAGHIAKQRIEADIEQKRLISEQTGLITDKISYDTHKKGLDAFKVVLLNLEKSRAAYGISIGQLAAQKSTNENLQISVITQKNNSMALASQQLRNAILEAANRRVAEGQKSITTLNSELMKKVATNTVLTAEESEKVLLNGVYSIEAALTAAKTVVDGCNAIKQARADRDQNIAQEMDKLKALVDEISPFITSMRESSETAKTQKNNSVANNSGLVF